MSKKVFFIECSVPFWMDVAEKLYARRTWTPVYWTGHHTFETEVTRRFPGICFHPNADAVRSIPAPPHRDCALPPLDEPLLNDLAVCERNTLQMMDRMIFDESLTYWDRVRLYHRYLRYWLAMLDHYRPSAVIFPNSPHLMYDYVLYELCKRQAIPTFLFSESAVNGLMYPAARFENCSDKVVAVYRQLLATLHEEPVLSSRTEEYIQKVQGSYSEAVPIWQKPYVNDEQAVEQQTPKNKTDNSAKPTFSLGMWMRGARQMLRPRRWFRDLWTRSQNRLQYLRAILSVLGDVRQADLPQAMEVLHSFRGFLHTLKEHGKDHPDVLADAIHATNALYKNYLETYQTTPPWQPAEPPGAYQVLKDVKPEESRYDAIEYQLFRILGAKKKINLKAHYEELAQVPDFSQPYIYLALHYQPEKATCPEGGVYVNQYLMADMLSKLVPDGWKVYIKDHPFQFELCGSGELTRVPQFYDDMAALPNVQLMPIRTSPFDLIDHARAVATSTGTSGWEAILRGRPVLAFGHSWYKGCEGVFNAANREDCAQALQQIAAGYQPDRRKVKIFLKALEKVGFYGYTILDMADWSGTTHEENVEAIQQVIERTILQSRAA